MGILIDSYYKDISPCGHSEYRQKSFSHNDEKKVLHLFDALESIPLEL